MHETQRLGIPGVGLEDIYLGNGASELIAMSLNALLDDGDDRPQNPRHCNHQSEQSDKRGVAGGYAARHRAAGRTARSGDLL